jgi:hypothetical protein
VAWFGVIRLTRCRAGWDELGLVGSTGFICHERLTWCIYDVSYVMSRIIWIYICLSTTQSDCTKRCHS